MRTSVFAILSLALGAQTLIGCNHGTNVEPLHRKRPAQTPAEPAAETPKAEAKPAPNKTPANAPATEAKPAPAPTPAPSVPAKAAPTVEDTKPRAALDPDEDKDADDDVTPAPATPSTPAPSVASLPGIFETPWCRVAPSGADFFVTRYTFTPEKVVIDQLKIAADQPPRVERILMEDSWAEVSSENVKPTKGRVAVERLNATDVGASPDFDLQNDVMDKMLAANGNLDEGGTERIGLSGGLRVSNYDPLVSTRRSQIVFPCAEFSTSFIEPAQPVVKTPPAPAPPAAAKPKPAPEKPVDPLSKVDPSLLRAPFKPFDVSRAALDNSRWCSWLKNENDVTIGVLQFHRDQKFSMTRFRKSDLERDLLTSIQLSGASIESVRTGSITEINGARFGTSLGQGYRLIDDRDDVRVLVADDARPTDAPAAGADVFFQCTSARIPGQTPLLRKNLTTYMDLRETWSRD